MKSSATISSCRRYRYELMREWGPGKVMIFVMLNPSTADDKENDPTIRRCLHFAKREGCGALLVLNLYAWRATDPKELDQVPDPVGRENDMFLKRNLNQWRNTVIVAGWGRRGAGRRADKLIEQYGSRIYCLGKTREGFPRHPLYLRNDAPLQPMVGD